MDEKYLTLKQNLCGARVFLNIFGLVLEQEEGINEYSKLKIFNNNDDEVGMLYFQNGEVNILANSNFGVLNAKYDITKVIGFEDFECGNALFVQWNTNINYRVCSDDQINFSGEMQIGCSMDTEFGNKCRVHTLLEYLHDNDKVTLKFMHDGSVFKYERNNNHERETINISPSDPFGNYITHFINRGNYDDDKHCYPYRYWSSVSRKSHREYILHALSFAGNYNEALTYQEDYVRMKGKECSSEVLMQTGLLMQQIDPDFTKKIEEIRGNFLVDGVSLFDNIIAVSLNSYTDEEVKALTGLDKIKINFQNGTDNLVDAYYGTGKNNKFIMSKDEKKYVKK